MVHALIKVKSKNKGTTHRYLLHHLYFDIFSTVKHFSNLILYSLNDLVEFI